MKKFLRSILLFAGISLTAAAVRAQANTSLSNLGTTSVNADLIPGTTNVRHLGSTTRSWKQLYIGDAIYFGNARFISFGTSLGNGVTAVGYKALAGNTGANNSALGFNALNFNTGGASNTALGSNALYRNTTGSNNVAGGASALYTNSTGSNNVAVGIGVLQLNTAGSSNTGLGAFSLQNNTVGYGNIAIGNQALRNNTSGWSSIAIGDSALYQQSGNMFGNTAVGSHALEEQGAYNFSTAVGANALQGGDGEANTALGFGALQNSTFDDNTAVGFNAGGAGSNMVSTFIGANAAGGNVTNSIAIGAFTSVNGDNQVRIGNGSVSSIGGAVGWSNLSDGRFKKNVKANVPGLDFIKSLRPVTYTYDATAFRRFTTPATGRSAGDNAATRNNKAEAALLASEEAKSKVVYTGFIAQEVEAAAGKMNFEFSGVDAPKSGKDYYGLRLGDFVAPLVQALKELSDKNDSLQAKVDQLAKLVQGANASNVSLTGASLGETSPNPFSASTNVSYLLPLNFGRAKMTITDMSGRVIKNIALSGQGRGNLTIDASNLAAGVYNYTLYVDDQLVNTKQMVKR